MMFKIRITIWNIPVICYSDEQKVPFIVFKYMRIILPVYLFYSCISCMVVFQFNQKNRFVRMIRSRQINQIRIAFSCRQLQNLCVIVARIEICKLDSVAEGCLTMITSGSGLLMGIFQNTCNRLSITTPGSLKQSL